MYKHGIVYTTVLCITLSLFSLCSNYALFKNFWAFNDASLSGDSLCHPNTALQHTYLAQKGTVQLQTGAITACQW